MYDIKTSWHSGLKIDGVKKDTESNPVIVVHGTDEDSADRTHGNLLEMNERGILFCIDEDRSVVFIPNARIVEILSRS